MYPEHPEPAEQGHANPGSDVMMNDRDNKSVQQPDVDNQQIMSPSSKKQKLIFESFKSTINIDIRSAFVLFMSTHSLPHWLLDSESFRDLLTLYRQGSIMPPTTKQLRSHIQEYATTLRTDLLDRLRNRIATICVDGWTNVRHDKVNNIVILCDGTAYYWSSVTNTLEQNTAEWIADHIRPKIQELLDGDVEVVAFVADNEAVNTATYNILKQDYPFMIHIPCAAHTIQLCVKYILKSGTLNEVIQAVGTMIAAFDRSKELRQKLKR